MLTRHSLCKGVCVKRGVFGARCDAFKRVFPIYTTYLPCSYIFNAIVGREKLIFSKIFVLMICFSTTMVIIFGTGNFDMHIVDWSSDSFLSYLYHHLAPFEGRDIDFLIPKLELCYL